MSDTRLCPLPRLMPHQIDWWASRARWKMIAGGRRVGKTVGGFRFVTDGHGGEGSPLRGALQGGRIGWLVPTNKQGRRVIWPLLKKALAPITVRKSEIDFSVELVSGGVVQVMSAQAPASELGVGLDGIVADEFARIDGRVWQETFRPMLSDRQGWAVFISTPRGFGNLFHDYHSRAEHEDGWEAWTTPTRANPMIAASELDEAQRELGAAIYAQEFEAQFVSDAIAVFKREHLRRWTTLPGRFGRVVQSWDCAFKDESDSDYVVGQVWGIEGANRYLLDQWRERADIVRTLEGMREMTARWPQSAEKYIEDKANGSAVVRLMRDKIDRIIPVNPMGGKVSRARAVQSYWEAGNVLLPPEDHAPWVRALVDEVTAFPNGVNDDQVDSMTQALARLRDVDARPNRPSEEPPMAAWADLASGGSF